MKCDSSNGMNSTIPSSFKVFLVSGSLINLFSNGCIKWNCPHVSNKHFLDIPPLYDGNTHSTKFFSKLVSILSFIESKSKRSSSKEFNFKEYCLYIIFS